MTISKTFSTDTQATAAFEKIQHAGISNQEETSVQVKFARFTLSDDTISATSSYYSEDTLRDAITSPEAL